MSSGGLRKFSANFSSGGESIKWCAGEDLNLHSLRNQILSLACLPFHHPRNGRKHDGKFLVSQERVYLHFSPGLSEQPIA